MKIIDLLNDIENDEIEDGTIFEVIGDFFYKLIIIDKNLYCINEMTKKLEILDSKYIGRFDNKQYEIIELSNKIEEEKKIPKKLEDKARFQYSQIPYWFKDKELIKTINENFEKHQKAIYEIIDYLKEKENK